MISQLNYFNFKLLKIKKLKNKVTNFYNLKLLHLDYLLYIDTLIVLFLFIISY